MNGSRPSALKEKLLDLQVWLEVIFRFAAGMLMILAGLAGLSFLGYLVYTFIF